MNRALKLLVVAALALVLVPYSYANEWVPPDMLVMVEAGPLQAAPIGSTASGQIRSLDNPTDVKKSGKRVINPVVQYTPMNDWVPLDIIRTWVIPFDP